MGFLESYKIVPKKPGRLLILLAVLLAVFIGDRLYRRWRPKVEITTAHYSILSSASPEQTRQVGEMVEILYSAYTRVFTNLPEERHTKMQLKLFKNQTEFKRANRGIGWAEAFYREPYCNAYFSSEEANPCHWMLHEAVHQLNNEVAHFSMPKWANEGTATYFSTSMIRNGSLAAGQIDPHTYPVWWVGSMALTGDIQKDIASNQIIPLRAIVTGKGGPGMGENFNLYYLHWWSLSHFLFHYQGGKYREAYIQVIRDGGGVEAFEKRVGPIERVQGEWYGYLTMLAKHY